MQNCDDENSKNQDLEMLRCWINSVIFFRSHKSGVNVVKGGFLYQKKRDALLGQKRRDVYFALYPSRLCSFFVSPAGPTIKDK